LLPDLVLYQTVIHPSQKLIEQRDEHKMFLTSFSKDGAPT
jgi:hypothetical protein